MIHFRNVECSGRRVRCRFTSATLAEFHAFGVNWHGPYPEWSLKFSRPYTIAYLIVPKSQLAGYGPEDAAYFSKPVEVEVPLFNDDVMPYVFDPIRSKTFPVERQNIVPYCMLTRRKRKLIELPVAAGVR